MEEIIIKYFKFSGTISGERYFIRSFLQSFLTIAWGFGLYLLCVTTYKRASALTDYKLIRILFCLNNFILWPLTILFSVSLGVEDYDFSIFFKNDIEYLTLLFVLSLSAHCYLIFKNSPIKKHTE